jgi:hypothetical protein
MVRLEVWKKIIVPLLSSLCSIPAYASPPLLLHLLLSADGHGGNPRLHLLMKFEGRRQTKRIF